MNPVILVPVKDAAKAKSRMSPLLNEDERIAVAWRIARGPDRRAAAPSLPNRGRDQFGANCGPRPQAGVADHPRADPDLGELPPWTKLPAASPTADTMRCCVCRPIFLW